MCTWLLICENKFLRGCTNSCLQETSSIFTKYLTDKREIREPETVTISLCHLRPVISIVGKLMILMISVILLLSASEFLITILNFCYRSIELKQMLFLHSVRTIFLLRIFALLD